MNTEKKWITPSSLDRLIGSLVKDRYKVFGPVKDGDQIDYSVIGSLAETEKDYVTTNQSAKSLVFPKYEGLFQMIKDKGSISLISKELEKLPNVILFGSRPCDARGILALNSIFDGDIKDQIYLGRLAKLTTISVSCVKHDETCFCTSLQSGPGDTMGSDLLLTPDGDNGFLVEIITEKGKHLVDHYPDCFEDEKELDKEARLTKVPVSFDINYIAGKLKSKFEDDIWIEQSLRCIGCGTCAYVCPTCGCFDIQDVSTGESMLRRRSWDSCGYDLFTLHASGHNPRKIQSQRWRQRIYHKFQYMPESDDVVGCVGCGRCSKTCSVDMNLKTHLINLANEL
ncbi:MAG: 4Fe-4S dicluster domain-containing protein [Proteobacteria bacterium]|nr:4Fe-4S dicluster domain-containing protein [Pseudomonadota bacterium]